MSILKTVDEDSFKKEVLDSEIPVLVDFSAVWCGPCKKQLPILEELAVEYQDTVKFVKLDIDDSPSIASQFKVRSIPTIMLFNKGKDIKVQIGMTSRSVLKKFIDE
jgi:thioredoxin 1